MTPCDSVSSQELVLVFTCLSNLRGAFPGDQAPCWALRTRCMCPRSQGARSPGGVVNSHHIVKLVIRILIIYTEQHADTIIGPSIKGVEVVALNL